MNLFNFTIPIVLVSCSVPTQHAKVAKWIQPTYTDCDLPILNSPPIDVGLTVLHTNLNRYNGFGSMRAHVIHNGTQMQIGAHTHDYQTAEIFNDFAGPNLLINSLWEDPENASWETASGQLIYSSAVYRADILSVNPITNEITNLTTDSESFYNIGATLASGSINYGAMVDGEMRPHSMGTNGGNKQSVAAAGGFAYGFSSSPDGSHYAFHSHYKVFIGDYSTGVEQQVQTSCNFNFLPIWSPDSKHVAFFCGANNIGPDIWVSDLQGSAKFLTGRGSYSGSVPIVDGPDFHGGASDNVTWSDANTVIYSGSESGSIELFAVDINTRTELQLTSTISSLNYYPTVSPDSAYLLFNSSRSGRRNTYYMDLKTYETKQITDVPSGCGIYNIKWRM